MMRISLLLLSVFSLALGDEEIWEKDMSNDVYIEGSTQGFEYVKLECGEKSMRVELKMEESFEGIFYTRGSYKSGVLPCFLDATGQTDLTLRIPFDDCKTEIQEGTGQTNTVIVQHDDWLIFPGDTAFDVSCNANSEDTPGQIMASIGLADPDPGAKELPKHRKSTVTAMNSVEFTPNDVRPRNKNKTAKSKKKRTTSKKRSKSQDPEERDEL